VDAPIPFPPEFWWIPYEKNTVLFTDGLSTKWSVYDFEGKLAKELTTPLFKPRKVTEKDLDEWRKRWKENADKDWYDRFGIVVEKYKKSIYEKMPNIDGLSLTPDGNILVAGEAAKELNMWIIGSWIKREKFWSMDAQTQQDCTLRGISFFTG